MLALDVLPIVSDHIYLQALDVLLVHVTVSHTLGVLLVYSFLRGNLWGQASPWVGGGFVVPTRPPCKTKRGEVAVQLTRIAYRKPGGKGRVP